MNPFEKIAFVPGAGTSTTQHTYRYDWRAPNPGQFQLRLKQIDFDGRFTYSDVFTLDITIDQPFRMTAPFPNPFNPTTQFNVVVAEDQDVQITVVDITGREVGTVI